MVEAKDYIFDDDSITSPPLVPAHLLPDLDTLVPIAVNAVTIQEVTIDEIPCEASYVSIESVVEPMVETTEMDNPPMDDSARAWSAGIAGGVVGTLVGGPVLGVIAGGTAAYFSGQDGVGGDTARAMGDVARTTGKKARELNRKHSLVDKSKQAAGNAWQKVRNLDKKHNIAKKGQEAATNAWKGAKDFNRKHGIIEKLGAFAVLCFKRFSMLIAEVSGRLIENEPVAQPQKTKIPPQKQQATCY